MFVLASPAVFCMSCSALLDGFRDEKQVTVQLLFCGVLLLGFVQYNS